MHEELNKFGNITKVSNISLCVFFRKNELLFKFKACPLKKGAHFYIKDFKIDQDRFPMPLPVRNFDSF